MNITIRYSSVDGFRETRRFKTIAGARRYATNLVGDFPEMGRSYAVSDDGVGKVTVAGDVTLRELFTAEAAPPPPKPADCDGPYCVTGQDCSDCRHCDRD